MGQEAGLPMFVQGLRLCVLSLPVDAFAVWAPADNILRGSGEREKLAMERSCAARTGWLWGVGECTWWMGRGKVSCQAWNWGRSLSNLHVLLYVAYKWRSSIFLVIIHSY